MSVLNRKMFNRGGRNKLNQMGGIKNVQHFQTAGPVVAPLSVPKWSVTGQVAGQIPGAEKGRIFAAPYSKNLRGGFTPFQRLLAKANEKGIGSLGPLELGLLNTMALQGVQAPDNFTGTSLEKGIRNVLGPIYKYGVAPATGMASGIAAALTGEGNLEEDSKFGEKLGATTPDRKLMESYGFKFFPTGGEELERFRKEARKQDETKKRLIKEEKEKLSQGPGPVPPEELLSGSAPPKDDLMEALEGTTVDVDPTTGNIKVLEDPSKPGNVFGETSFTPKNVESEGFGKQLDVDLGEEGTGTGTDTDTDTKEKKSDIAPPVLRPPELVKEVFKTGNEEQKANVVDDIIKQFTDRAPKYEGLNQGLAIAKIGFAMAAGESPNALTNIAKALNDGADMLIKDKKERDAFNRQIKLSGLQLGLTEQFKISAEERLIEREMAKEGRKPLFFVADKNLNFNGIDYEKGETVAIPTSFITENGLPKGFTTSDLARAALDKQSALEKLINQKKKDAIISTKTHQEYLEKVSVATGDFVSANSMRNLVEANIIRNAEGDITGVGPAFTQLINKAYSAGGIETGKEYENVDAFNKDMRIVSNLLLKDLLGEGSKNVSNIDRKLADEIVGLASAFGGYVFQDPDLINTRLQMFL